MAVRALAAMSDCSQPEQGLASGGGGADVLVGRRLGGQARCSSRRSRPSVSSSGWSAARRLVSSRRGIAPLIAGERAPQLVAGVRQPQMQLVVGRQRVEQFDIGACQAGVPEQRQPCRQVGRPFAQPGDGLLVTDVRGIGVDALDQRPPQFGLPGQVGVEVLRIAVQPVDQQLRTLPSVGGEQARPAVRATEYRRPRRSSASASVSKWPKCVASMRHQG